MNKNGWIEHIPVITISSETASTYIDHAYDLGASDYISRPFDEKTVQRRVRNTIMLYSKQKMLEGMVAEQIVEKERNNFLMVEILSNIVEFRNGESGPACAAHPHPDRNAAAASCRRPPTAIRFRRPDSADRQRLGAARHRQDLDPRADTQQARQADPEEFEVMKTHSAHRRADHGGRAAAPPGGAAAAGL